MIIHHSCIVKPVKSEELKYESCFVFYLGINIIYTVIYDKKICIMFFKNSYSRIVFQITKAKKIE